MAVSKRLKNSGTPKWVCPHKCKITSTPCPHLERLVAEPVKQRFENVYTYVGRNVDRSLEEIEDDTGYEHKFRQKLKELKIGELESDVLVLRLIYKMSFSEISQEIGVITTSHAHRIFKQANDLALAKVVKQKRGR